MKGWFRAAVFSSEDVIEMDLLHVGEGAQELRLDLPERDYLRWEVLSRDGHPAERILQTAAERDCGMIAMTTDGVGGLFGGSTMELVVKSAHCPVLVVPVEDYDISEEVVSPALWARGIRHLDAVALSHAHSDHMGGLPAVLRNFHPDELWVGNNPPVSAYNDLLQQAAALHVRLRSFHSGDAFPFASTQIAVLAPTPDYLPGPEPSNNNSLVLHVAYGATSVLLEGDAEAPVEHAVVAQAMLPGLSLQSTLLKVGHHGSITSTQPEFLDQVAPKWAVISFGLRNRYGHPRQEVLQRLQSAHVRTFLTEVNGAACFQLDGQTVAPDLNCASHSDP